MRKAGRGRDLQRRYGKKIGGWSLAAKSAAGSRGPWSFVFFVARPSHPISKLISFELRRLSSGLCRC